MKQITCENVIYQMSKNNTPVLSVDVGEVISFETLDCFNNDLLKEGSTIADLTKNSNPATGPLYIRGAEIGDTLRVEILDIQVGAIGVAGAGPTNYYFKEHMTEYKVRRIPVNKGMAKLYENVEVPITPMIGVIGVAPFGEGISTSLVGEHGGNIDCKQIKKGAVVYLPVFTEGALLAIGDLHAIMGDGEVSECGLEIEGSVAVKVSVIKDTKREVPAVYVDGKWITIASCKTLDEASEEATRMMFECLLAHGIDPYDAGMLLSLFGNLVICQSCGYYMTIRMEFNLELIKKMGYPLLLK